MEGRKQRGRIPVGSESIIIKTYFDLFFFFFFRRIPPRRIGSPGGSFLCIHMECRAHKPQRKPGVVQVCIKKIFIGHRRGTDGHKADSDKAEKERFITF